MDVMLCYWYDSNEDKYHLHVRTDDDCLNSHTRIDLAMRDEAGRMQGAGILKSIMCFLARDYCAKFHVLNGPESFGENLRKLDGDEENLVLEALGGIKKEPKIKS